MNPPAGGPAIVVENMSIEYRLVHERSAGLKESIIRLLRGERERAEDFRALSGISFAVREGEAMGVIGPNGSGKTTLLKILAGVLFPTEGRVDIRGQVTTLIDLGAGFIPDMSGAENILVTGALYGISRKEMKKKLPRIVEFAELERFLDVPVKNYSAGMSARLGFAIATDVDPDVLLVDEVLGVGDRSFQEKCFERMNSFRKRGKTIVLVSHDLGTVRHFCDRAIYLERGKIMAEGPAEEVVRRYENGAAPPG